MAPDGPMRVSTKEFRWWAPRRLAPGRRALGAQQAPALSRGHKEPGRQCGQTGTFKGVHCSPKVPWIPVAAPQRSPEAQLRGRQPLVHGSHTWRPSSRQCTRPGGLPAFKTAAAAPAGAYRRGHASPRQPWAGSGASPPRPRLRPARHSAGARSPSRPRPMPPPRPVTPSEPGLQALHLAPWPGSGRPAPRHRTHPTPPHPPYPTPPHPTPPQELATKHPSALLQHPPRRAGAAGDGAGGVQDQPGERPPRTRSCARVRLH